jgi:hypothetical protein
MHTRQETLIESFQTRMVNGLVENNVLRGSWAEEVVAYWLDVEAFPPQWCYYDLRLESTTISIKHSTGRSPAFGVKQSVWAWDPELAQDGEHYGWRGNDGRQPQHWCNVYVFAWLDEPVVLARILDPTAWRFWVLSRNEMYLCSYPGAKTMGAARLRSISGQPSRGEELRNLFARKANTVLDPAVPALDLTPWEDLVAGARCPTTTRDVASPPQVEIATSDHPPSTP